MKKRTAILLAVFMLTVGGYVGIPYLQFGNPLTEVSAATLRPGSSVGFRLATFQSNKGLFVRNITKSGPPAPGQNPVPDTITYEQKPTIHTLVLAIMEADLHTIDKATIWTKTVVDSTANDYYNLAEAIYLVGEQRDQRPRTR